MPYVNHCLRVQWATEGVIMLLQSWRMNPGAMEMCGYKMTSVHYCPAHDPLQSHQRSLALQPRPSYSLLHGNFAASRLLFITRRSETHKTKFLFNGQVWTTSMVWWSEFLATDPEVGFDSRCYQIFWERVGLERGPLSLVSTTEELLERNSSGSGLETREYDHRDPSRWPRGTLNTQMLALTRPTSGGRSVGIVRSRTKATEFLVFLTEDFIDEH
jgi:hypothetical protein